MKRNKNKKKIPGVYFRLKDMVEEVKVQYNYFVDDVTSCTLVAIIKVPHIPDDLAKAIVNRFSGLQCCYTDGAFLVTIYKSSKCHAPDTPNVEMGEKVAYTKARTHLYNVATRIYIQLDTYALKMEKKAHELVTSAARYLEREYNYYKKLENNNETNN